MCVCVFVCVCVSVCFCVCVHPGRVSLTGGASLLVEGLSLEDEGWFECRILLLDHTTDELRNGTWTFLSITGVTRQRDPRPGPLARKARLRGPQSCYCPPLRVDPQGPPRHGGPCLVLS